MAREFGPQRWGSLGPVGGKAPLVKIGDLEGMETFGRSHQVRWDDRDDALSQCCPVHRQWSKQEIDITRGALKALSVMFLFFSESLDRCNYWNIPACSCSESCRIGLFLDSLGKFFHADQGSRVLDSRYPLRCHGFDPVGGGQDWQVVFVNRCWSSSWDWLICNSWLHMCAMFGMMDRSWEGLW